MDSDTHLFSPAGAWLTSCCQLPQLSLTGLVCRRGRGAPWGMSRRRCWCPGGGLRYGPCHALRRCGVLPCTDALLPCIEPNMACGRVAHIGPDVVCNVLSARAASFQLLWERPSVQARPANTVSKAHCACLVCSIVLRPGRLADCLIQRLWAWATTLTLHLHTCLGALRG